MESLFFLFSLDLNFALLYLVLGNIAFMIILQGFQGKTGPPGPGGVVGPQVHHLISYLTSKNHF